MAHGWTGRSLPSLETVTDPVLLCLTRALQQYRETQKQLHADGEDDVHLVRSMRWKGSKPIARALLYILASTGSLIFYSIVLV